MSVLLSIAIFILILSFLVIIHELGHFFAAKYAGITVKEFGIGYPPKAIKMFSWKGTDFTLNWIPFGGFVRMDGEEAEPDARNKQAKKGEFYAASITHRLIVVLAGAAVNLVFGICAFAAIFSHIGIPEPISQARIGYISPDSPAAKAGLQKSTEIVGFKLSADSDLVTMSSTADVINFVQENKGKEVIVLTSGNCEGIQCDYSVSEHSVYLRAVEETPENEGSMGVAFDSVVFVHYPWWQMPGKATLYGLQESLNLGKEILKALSKLGSDLVQKREVSAELAGPVGIVHQAHSAGILNQGFIMMLSFAAMLSINLAIMNVLPIPPLDGGKAVFTILETIFSRKHLYKLEYWFSYTGYFLLMALILFITARDVINLFA